MAPRGTPPGTTAAQGERWMIRSRCSGNDARAVVARAKLQILESVVELVAVDVMHGLAARKWTAECLSHDQPVLGHVSADVPHRRSRVIVIEEPNEDITLLRVPAPLPVRRPRAELGTPLGAEPKPVRFATVERRAAIETSPRIRARTVLPADIPPLARLVLFRGHSGFASRLRNAFTASELQAALPALPCLVKPLHSGAAAQAVLHFSFAARLLHGVSLRRASAVARTGNR
jgi:hypothetical protein